MNQVKRWFSRINWPLAMIASIVALGLGLRLWGIGFGLPHLYHPDEGVPVTIALRMIRTGNLDPDFFDWPSLTLYLNALVYLAYFFFGKAMGWFAAPTDLLLPDIVTVAVGKAFLPEEFLLARGLTAIFGALGVVAVYLICRDLSGRRIAGWLGALWFAVEPVGIRHSQYVRPDTFLVTFALFALWFALRIVDDPRPRHYLLAGICAGLATSSKYNAAFIVLPIAAAHFARFGVRGFARKEIYLAALASLLAFFATTPYALLDWNRFWQAGILGNAAHYAGGHVGAEGDVLRWYVGFLWATNGALLPLALLESLGVVARCEVKGIVVLAFPIVYFVFINLYTVRFESTILPVIPFVIVLAVGLVVRLYDFALQRATMNRRVFGAALIAVAMLFALPMVRVAAEYNVSILRPDTREAARVWIDANLPSGARVVVEPYAPYVDPARFTVEGGSAVIARSPEWYVQNGFEYLVLSEGTFGRFFDNVERYADSVRQYNAFFARFVEVRRFVGSGPEIRVYQTGVTDLPTHRVAARFGDYGDLIELVGYDAVTSRTLPGESLRVTIFWRVLKPANEPLELALHLLGRDERVVATRRDDLFQHKYSGWAWPQGIFSTEWTMPIPQDAESGRYFLQAEVTQTRFAHTLPARSWADEPMPAVLLGAFKVSAPPPSAAELQSARMASARWGDQIALTAYMFDPSAQPGDTWRITLYWTCLTKPAQDYTVFVHLLDAEGKLRAQLDMQPRGGAYPTSIWDVGEIVRDEYALTLPGDLAPGEYRVAIGLYEYPSLIRMRVQSGGKEIGDYMLLDEIVQVTP